MTAQLVRSFRQLAFAALLGLATLPTSAAATDCHVGAYRLASGEIVDIGPSTEGALRWRKLDGETGRIARTGEDWVSTVGWTDRADGIRVRFGDCASGTIRFGDEAGSRIAFSVQETSFVSHDTRLPGRLILPAGNDPVPIVVLLHGAERDSARDLNALQRVLPAMGIGAFVYDKRGTGDAEGTYTQDFPTLADDAVAALQEARRLAGPRAGRIGFQGPSQGGWIAPIAATRSRVDFIIVSFGLAVSVVDEDIEAIEFQMRLKGWGQNEIAKALEIARAAHRLFESGFTEGFEEFDAVRARYRDAPWYRDVYGNFTHIILGTTSDQLRAERPFRFGTPFRYDPMATIEAVPVPQLWVLGGQDIDAPSGETARRLRTLIDRGRPITLALYPTAEHGLTEFETAPDGTRVSTRYVSGYYRMMRDFVRSGALRPPYGDARITGPGQR